MNKSNIDYSKRFKELASGIIQAGYTEIYSDFDDTLTNTVEVLIEIAESKGVSFSEKERSEIAKMESSAFLIFLLKKTKNLALSVQVMNDLKKPEWSTKIRILPGVKDFITKLKENGIKFKIVTSNDTQLALKVLEANQISTPEEIKVYPAGKFSKYFGYKKAIKDNEPEATDTKDTNQNENPRKILLVGDSYRDFIAAIDLVGLTSLEINYLDVNKYFGTENEDWNKPKPKETSENFFGWIK